MATFGELKSRVIGNLGRDLAVVREKVGQWVNDEAQSVGNMADWWFLETSVSLTTVQGVVEYSLPTGLRTFRDAWIVSDGRWWPLDRASESGLMILSGNSSSQGAPSMYALRPGDAKLLIGPAPDGEYEVLVRYWAALPLLVNDDDTNALTERWPLVVEAGATLRGAATLQDSEVMAAFRAVYQGALEALWRAHRDAVRSGPLQLIPYRGARRSAVQLS